MFTGLINTVESKMVLSREFAHEVDGLVEDCRLPLTLFKKEGSMWVCPTCEAKYRLEYEVVRGAMAGLNTSGNVWVQVG